MAAGRVIVAVALAGAIIGLGGCEYSPESSVRTIAFNEAIERSTNQLLLLNIVRASERMPAYYSRLETNNASGSINPQFQLANPLSHSTMVQTAVAGITRTVSRSALGLTSTLGGTEQNQLTLQNLDDQDYITGMMTPLKLDMYNYYTGAGWPAETLLLMFVQEIDVPADTAEVVFSDAIKQCDAPPISSVASSEPIAKMCNALKNQLVTPLAKKKDKEAPALPGSKAASVAEYTECIRDISETRNGTMAVGPSGKNKTGSIIFVNDPAWDGPTGSTVRPENCFHDLVRAFLVLGIGPGGGAGKKVSVIQKGLPDALRSDGKFMATLVTNDWVVSDSDGRRFSLCKVAAADATLSFSNLPPKNPEDTSTGEKKSLSEACSDAAAKLGDPGADAASGNVSVALEHKNLELKFRSLEGMVYFLGEDVRAQAQPGGTKANSVMTTESYGDDVSLFAVRRGSAPSSSPVSVEFNGENFYVEPIVSPDSSGAGAAAYTFEHPHNRSLDVLTLVNQIWGLQKKATSPPTVLPVTVVSP